VQSGNLGQNVCNSASTGAALLKGTVDAQLEPNTAIQFTAKKIRFLHNYATCFGHYDHHEAKSVQKAQEKVNVNVKRGFSLRSIVIFAYTLP
jgi:aminoglycoside phosphotransferase